MSILPPNCIVPSATSLTISPVFPNFLYFISYSFPLGWIDQSEKRSAGTLSRGCISAALRPRASRLRAKSSSRHAAARTHVAAYSVPQSLNDGDDLVGFHLLIQRDAL